MANEPQNLPNRHNAPKIDWPPGNPSSVFRILYSVFCVTLHLSRTLYKSTLFMQNKPSFQNAKNERKLICYRGL